MTQHSPTHTAIITGGNRGLGYECARTILSNNRDWAVVLATRNQQRAIEAVSSLSSETGNENVSTLELDLASLDSVREFADAVHDRLDAETLPPLKALVCNAGILQTSGTAYTEDDFELTFGVNHLGHFLLVNLLINGMEPPGRVVFVSSGTHNPAEFWPRVTGIPAPQLTDAHTLAFPNEDSETDPTQLGQMRYSTSKLAVLLTAYELDRRLRASSPHVSGERITSNAFDPGLMPGTGLARDQGGVEQFLWNHVLPILRPLPGANSPKMSGSNLAWLVTEPALESVSGEYFIEREPAGSSLESYDERVARQLWSESSDLVGIETDVKDTPENPTISRADPKSS